jgi:opacity protein-like surface antigen
VRLILLKIAVLLFPIFALGQATTPQWEIYGGYQLTRLDTSAAQNASDQATTALALPSVDIGNGLNMNGWAASLAENKNNWFGGLVEGSGSYATKNINLSPLAAALGLPTPVTAQFKPSFYTFAAGPQFSYRRSAKFQPFVHVLLGVAHVDLSPQHQTKTILPVVAPLLKTSDTAFALLAGGGIDFPFYHDRLALRAQGDYVRSYLYNQFTNEQNNFRVNAGLVFRFGSR